MRAKKLYNNQIVKVILIFIMLTALLMSIWLFISPSIKKKEDLKKQDALIMKIESSTKLSVAFEQEFESNIFESDIFESDIENESFGEVIFGDIAFGEVIFEKESVPIGSELGILTIERLNMKLPVVEGVTEEILNIAVGHVPQTAAVGDLGNAVIAGHRMYKYGQFFNRLGEIEYGDVINFTSTSGEEMNFLVDEILEVEAHNDQIAFNQPKDIVQITLYTCTPIRTATHRLLIRASLIN